MVSFWAYMTLVLALPWAGAFVSKRQTVKDLKRGYIIEFKDGIDATTDAFIAELKAKEQLTLTRHEYTSSLFKGFSFDLDEKGDVNAAIERISAMPHIQRYAQPQEFVVAGQRQRTDYAEPWHKATGVDQLRKAGYTGKGARAAVIDSGIDYKHPALGGCFGKGCLVEYGKHLFGTPSDDPFEGRHYHGTHVSGIATAQKNPFGFMGVAPGVTLGHYRVLGYEEPNQNSSLSNDIGFTDTLIKAYLDAFEAKTDIITTSVGKFSGWSADSWAIVIERIVSKGVICLGAAGNDGNPGPFLGADSNSAFSSIGVGYINNVELPAILPGAFYTTSHGNKPFAWAMVSEFNNGTSPLAEVRQNACEPLPATLNLSGTAILYSLGTCAPDTQVKNLADRNATSIIFCNREDNVVPPWHLPPLLKAWEFCPRHIAKSSRLLHQITALCPVIQQGAGIIDAHKAFKARTIISPHNLLFKDTENFQKSLSFSIWNSGSSPVTYHIKHVPVRSVYTLAENPTGTSPSLFDSTGTPETVANYATLKFSHSNVTVQPGHKGRVDVYPSLPIGLIASCLPLYNGFITINATNEAYTIPYLGAASSMRKVIVLGRLAPENTFKIGQRGPDIKEGDTIEIKEPEMQHAPTFLRRLVMGTP
ncbi:hypothetical protein LOZ58_004911 [Ophidiomyces ophidiicola]|nr:hypothetical protein LOZ58_004911 [Ophidiomyces ophidiicola]